MWSEKFEQVIRGLCEIYNVDAKHVLDGSPLTMNGMMFALHHDKEIDSPQLTAYCNFGKVPQELEAKAYRRLLETNLAIHSGQGGEAFCVDQDGNVVFVVDYPLEITEPAELAAYLALTAQHAQRWREGYFLSEEDEPRKKTWAGTRLLQKARAGEGED
ncbi:MAG TPA: CesT family type III secretion system chaperone [Noviherbaspirillum sp.]